MIMANSNKESAQKSYRLSERREGDREREAGGYFAKGRCPAWLVWDDGFEWKGKRGWFRPIPERVSWIVWIFNRAAEGMALYAICRELTARNVPPFNTKLREQWSTTYLSKLIRTQAVLGVWQPCKMVNGKAVPEGEPVPDYYPAVVPADLWLKAQRARREKNAPLNRTGANGAHMTSLFSGLTWCAECSTPERPVAMNVCASERRSNGRKYVYLRCTAKEHGFEWCRCSGFRHNFAYGEFEKSALAHVSEIDGGSVLGDKNPALQAVEAERGTAQHRLQTHIEDEHRLATRYDGEANEAKAEIILERLVRKRAEIATAREELARLDTERAKLDHKRGQQSQIGDMIARLQSELEAAEGHERYALRARLSAALRTVIDSIHFHAATGDVDLLVEGWKRYRLNGLSRVWEDATFRIAGVSAAEVERYVRAQEERDGEDYRARITEDADVVKITAEPVMAFCAKLALHSPERRRKAAQRTRS